MSLVDIRVDRHRTGAEEAEASSAKIGHFDPFECYDRFRRHVECCRGVAPDSQPNGEIRVVDKGELALVVRFAGGLRDDLRGFSNFFENTNGVDCGIFLNSLQVADAGEVESDLRNSFLLFRL